MPATLGVVATVLSCLPGTSEAYESDFSAANSDRSVILFKTGRSLGPADPPGEDLYRFESGEIERLDTGPDDPPHQSGVSVSAVNEAGDSYVFNTDRRASPADPDSEVDAYLHADGANVLLSGVGGRSTIVGASSDLSTVFFIADADLLPSDTDGEADLYRYGAGTLTHESVGSAGGNAPGHPVPAYQGDWVSADGERVLFKTDEALTAEDHDDEFDYYLRIGSSETELVSLDAVGTDEPEPPVSGRLSPDGARVLFTTRGALLPADDDDEYDFYLWSGGTLSQVSVDSGGRNTPGRNADDAEIVGDIVYFESWDALVPGDENGVPDVYRWEDGGVTLASGIAGVTGEKQAHLVGTAPMAERAYVSSKSSYDARDTNPVTDVYAHDADGLELVAPDGGVGESSIGFVSATPDGSHVAISSRLSFVEADNDCPAADPPGCRDIYVVGPERRVRLVTGAWDDDATHPDDEGHGTAFPGALNYRTGAFGLGADGDALAFLSWHRLTPDDTNEMIDIYLWRDGRTTLLTGSGERESWLTSDVAPPQVDPPQARITAGPRGWIGTDRTTFRFTATPSGSTFECALNSDRFSPCSGSAGSHALVGLQEGRHTFSVRARSLGAVGPVVRRNFGVDTVDPNVWFRKRPKKKSAARRPRFKLRASEAVSLQCRLDRRRWKPCRRSHRLRRIRRGRHVYRVRALDRAGNRDATPAKWQWRRVRSN